MAEAVRANTLSDVKPDSHKEDPVHVKEEKSKLKLVVSENTFGFPVVAPDTDLDRTQHTTLIWATPISSHCRQKGNKRNQ
jgi:hypothetical protein